MTAIVALDGFLRDGVGGPYVTGEMLFRALSENYRVVISHEGPEEDAKSWLLRRGIYKKVAAIYGDGTIGDHVSRERVQSSVSFVITPDTEQARQIAAQGITVMLIAASDFVDPRWRPERKTWGQLKEEGAV